MRTIKFRAWEDGEMINDITLFDANETRSGVPMQFTGLLDKNGKEIYEGDVVSFHAFTFNGSETEYEGKGIVKYRPDGMCFVFEEKNDFDWMVRDTSNFGEACFEIIGNIYENPELLN